MADVEERAKAHPPPKRRRVNDDDDDDSLPSPRRTSAPSNGAAKRETPSPSPRRDESPKIKRQADPVEADPIVDDAPIPRHPPAAPAATPPASPPASTLATASVAAPAADQLDSAPQDEPPVPRHAVPAPKDEYQPPSAPPVPPAPPVDYQPSARPSSYPPPPPGSGPTAAPAASDAGGGGGGVVRMPSGLTPDVDAVLEKIFLSGLFARQDIDGRALDFLASVTPALAMAALEDIQHRDFSTVRNKPAFIMSIFKRVVASGGSALRAQQPPPGGYAPTSVPASALAHLPASVSDALQHVFASGVCHPSQFDDRAMDILVDLHEPDAVRALSEFAAMERGQIRNPSAFWMGLARKYKGQARRDPLMGGGYGGNDGYGTYGRGMAGGGYSAVDQRVQELISHGALPPNPFDDRALDALRRLPEQDAMSVLAELPEPSRVRNMSAYVMGLCKKFASGEARSLVGSRGGYAAPVGYDAGGAYGGGYGGGGGAYGTPPSYGAPPGPGGYSSGPSPYGPPGPGVGSGPPPAPPAVGAEQSSGEVRAAMNAMDPSVRERFYGMIDRGMFPETAFDQRAVAALQTMRSEEACAALDELAASDPGRIHNISAYFMGLAKKFSRAGM